MRYWQDIPFLKGLSPARGPEAAPVLMEDDILDDDPDFTADDLDPDNPDVADHALLAAVMAQTGEVAAAPSRPEPPSRRVIAWKLPGFESKCRVTTSFGDLPIEALRVRDQVRTISGAYREVRWIDRIRLDADFLSRHPEALPVMIRAKALGGVGPAKNMLVSPGQTVWVPKVSDGYRATLAGELDGQPNIMRTRRPELTYYRFHCGGPEKVCVEGSWFCTAPPEA